MSAKATPVELLNDDEFKTRFWAGVQPSTDEKCWPWMRSCVGKGYNRYGQFHIDRKGYKAHRIAFFLSKGYDSRVVRHTCDNPICCNPNHLLGGTHHDNTQDMLARNRCNPPVGERSGHAKLNDELAVAIRLEYAAGGTSYTKLAAKYSVTFQLIGHLVTRKIWRHLP